MAEPGNLELIQVTKRYGATVAVDAIDLRVAAGSYCCLLGPSGCGKTTTLRMIAGFEALTSGDILIRGRSVENLPAQARPTSTIFQNFALFPHMTVAENIEYGLSVKGVPSAERRRRMAAIMEKLEIANIADRKAPQLSGGQRQRVALARGLVVEPEILLLDEPLGALDANLRRSIQNELKLLQRALGITFVFVTHAQSEALSLSDRVVVMNRGAVEQISKPYDLYTRPKTPFVARFIGRNTIIPGRLVAASGGEAMVETGHGRLTGSLAEGAGARPGDAVELVIPAEAIDLRAETGDTPSGNELACRVDSVETVGPTVFSIVRLLNGQSVSLETYVGKYADAPVKAEGAARISWAAGDATVVPAAA